MMEESVLRAVADTLEYDDDEDLDDDDDDNDGSDLLLKDLLLLNEGDDDPRYDDPLGLDLRWDLDTVDRAELLGEDVLTSHLRQDPRHRRLFSGFAEPYPLVSVLSSGWYQTCGIIHPNGHADADGLPTGYGKQEAFCFGNDHYAKSTAVPHHHTYVQIAAGTFHVCAVLAPVDEDDESRPIECWGSNTEGQVDPIPFIAARPELYVNKGVDDGYAGFPVWQITSGGRHSCAVKHTIAIDGSDNRGGPVLCWGANEKGQISNPCKHCTTAQQRAHDGWAIAYPMGKSWKASYVSGGAAFTCGLQLGTGDISCWGLNFHKQSEPPRYLNTGMVEGGVMQVSAGTFHTCGVKRPDDYKAVCWGWNHYGEGQPPEGMTFAEVSVGTHHSCGIRRTDRRISCWGDNTHGQTQPPSKWRRKRYHQVSCGGHHCCAIREDTLGINCWGIDDYFTLRPPDIQVYADLALTCLPGGYGATDGRCTDSTAALAAANAAGLCNPGRFGNVTVGCATCTPGGYCPLGSEAPFVCPEGRYNSKFGGKVFANCTGCRQGKYSPVLGGTTQDVCAFRCPRGHYCPTGSGWPTECPRGSYNERVGRQVLRHCFECPNGFFSGVLASNTSTSCTTCPKGFLCPQGAADPAPCGVGTYSDMVKMFDPGNCSNCPPGTYNPHVGKPSLDDCLPCPIAFFCPKWALDSVTECPALHTTLSEGASELDHCVWNDTAWTILGICLGVPTLICLVHSFRKYRQRVKRVALARARYSNEGGKCEAAQKVLNQEMWRAKNSFSGRLKRMMRGRKKKNLYAVAKAAAKKSKKKMTYQEIIAQKAKKKKEEKAKAEAEAKRRAEEEAKASDSGSDTSESSAASGGEKKKKTKSEKLAALEAEFLKR